MVNEDVYKCKLELVAIAKHCNLKASRPRASRSGLLAVMFYTAHACKLLFRSLRPKF